MALAAQPKKQKGWLFFFLSIKGETFKHTKDLGFIFPGVVTIYVDIRQTIWPAIPILMWEAYKYKNICANNSSSNWVGVRDLSYKFHLYRDNQKIPILLRELVIENNQEQLAQ